MYIKNIKDLSTTKERELLLTLANVGLESLEMDKVINRSIHLTNTPNPILTIQENKYDLTHYKRLFLLGFGKGSARACKLVENILGRYLAQGWVIDTQKENFEKCEFTIGTHPLPSQANVDFTSNVLKSLNNLTPSDLVIVVICGGGSAMFCHPNNISLDEKININSQLLKSGATIDEMNIVRKHLSSVKGGQLAKTLHPATVASLVFSDVVGNNLSVIASGPTVMDQTTINDAIQIKEKYGLAIDPQKFSETPKEADIFKNVHNFLLLSNKTALLAMEQKAKILGYQTFIYTDQMIGAASDVGRILLENTPKGTLLFAGGETTVMVRGKGTGGRNQELVLGCLEYLTHNTTILSFASDGWDNCEFAGAIADHGTLVKAQRENISPKAFLQNNDSFHFFQKIGDGLTMGRLPINIADLAIVYKK